MFTFTVNPITHKNVGVYELAAKQSLLTPRKFVVILVVKIVKTWLPKNYTENGWRKDIK